MHQRLAKWTVQQMPRHDVQQVIMCSVASKWKHVTNVSYRTMRWTWYHDVQICSAAANALKFIPLRKCCTSISSEAVVMKSQLYVIAWCLKTQLQSCAIILKLVGETSAWYGSTIHICIRRLQVGPCCSSQSVLLSPKLSVGDTRQYKTSQVKREEFNLLSVWMVWKKFQAGNTE